MEVWLQVQVADSHLTDYFTRLIWPDIQCCCIWPTAQLVKWESVSYNFLRWVGQMRISHLQPSLNGDITRSWNTDGSRWSVLIVNSVTLGATLKTDYNNNNNTGTIFMVLSSWLAKVHPVYLTNVGQRQAATDPQTRPTDLGYQSVYRLLWRTSTIVIYY